jgi:hypothetical protein
MQARASQFQRIGRRKVDKDGAITWISQCDWEGDQRQPDAQATQQSKFAFCIDDSDMKSKIKIANPGLVNSIKKIIPHTLFESISGSVHFQEPYSALFQYSSDVRQELQSRHDPGSQVIVDFNVLVTFLESHAEYGIWKSLNGQNQDSITFENLWALFRDGDVLVLQDQLEERRLFKLTRLEEQINDEGFLKGFCMGIHIHFWHISWSSGDKAFRRYNRAIKIPKFAGMRKISALPIYPLRYETEETRTAVLRDLQNRGQTWSTRVSKPPACFEYDGHAVLSEDEVARDDAEPNYVSH